ncbi:class I SAM-dependent methyltransferase [Sporobolomyces koalae]|uniref:class I SAM-dependent methyltransferase n=1 Tax=Sporobolomyces koalae TaxID=500713 RepID=UPI00317E8A18
MSTTTSPLAPASSSRGNEFTTFAEDNFSTSGASGLYDRARPSYPQPAFDKILSLLKPESNSTVVELGAGTGLFTRGFLETAISSKQHQIKRLIAVEPSRGMRQGWNEKSNVAELEQNGIEASIEDGLFDKIPVADTTADLVVVAQAFHWVGKDGESSIRDIARVLKPQGTLALIWNFEDRSVPWVAQLRDAYEQHEAGTPQARLGWWKSVFDTQFYQDTYEPPQIEKYHRELPTTEQGVVDRILSKSYITALDEAEQDRIAHEMRQIVQRGQGKQWIEKEQGTFHYPYNTELYLIRKA